MKKKLLTAALSMVLCLGMSVTAFAADSPVADQPGSDQSVVGVVGGGEIPSDWDGKVGAVIVDPDYEKANINPDVPEAQKLYDDFRTAWDSDDENVVFDYTDGVAAEVGASLDYQGVTLAMLVGEPNVPTAFAGFGLVHAGDRIVVVHLDLATGKKEIVPASVIGDGAISITSSSYSPFIVYSYPAVSNSVHTHYWQEYTVAPTATTWGYTMHYCAGCGESYADTYIAPTSAAGSAAASPKTTESSAPMIMLFAAAALAGSAVVYTKRRQA